MDLQYISDANGNHTAVIIAIEDWQNLTSKHDDLRELEQKHQRASADKKNITDNQLFRRAGSLKRLGALKGKIFDIPDDFNEPLDDLRDYM